jgi:hypothetical protein
MKKQTHFIRKIAALSSTNGAPPPTAKRHRPSPSWRHEYRQLSSLKLAASRAQPRERTEKTNPLRDRESKKQTHYAIANRKNKPT